ncbi:hypothetical protein BWQ93_06675 [Sphingopyxis sp. QXT-31]|uniref:hypothetical protein n=1 Tax=Sphingopyxis sp. QXT-31 TaxID=1357916 RepID=UPI0009791309|nr:hypothetical protein [Sphingopyxis sp. QXT-31]APZ98194.1 hypothetical protein BWQ93_06675 [Sphingopyxis sp. QXT-31]
MGRRLIIHRFPAFAAPLALLLAGCQGVDRADAMAAAAQAQTPASAAALCPPDGKRAAGGKAQPDARFDCYADAGKACAGGGDCAGDCLVPNDRASRILQPGQKVAGVCQATASPFGCRATVEDGRVAMPRICRD